MEEECETKDRGEEICQFHGYNIWLLRSFLSGVSRRCIESCGKIGRGCVYNTLMELVTRLEQATVYTVVGGHKCNPSDHL